MVKSLSFDLVESSNKQLDSSIDAILKGQLIHKYMEPTIVAFQFYHITFNFLTCIQ